MGGSATLRTRLTESFPIQFGHYELLDHLAVGGMADLFLARVAGETRAGERVVVKRLFPHLAKQPGYSEMFLDEARLTARMAHPKIARTYDFGDHGGQLFMAMELVDGIDALAMLRECAQLKRRISSELSVFIAHEILDALDFAHNQVDDNGRPLGVVHRDISPSNVLISLQGEVKLVDFGIAWATRRSHHTQTGMLKGKYGYLSPEQIVFEEVDARSDLFSVGVLLAELLTGRRLFSAQRELDVLLMVRDVDLDRLDRHSDRIEPALDAILRKALRKQPDERFATAAAFRDALAAWLDEHARGDAQARLTKLVKALYQRVWNRRHGTTEPEPEPEPAAMVSAAEVVKAPDATPAAPPDVAPPDVAPPDVAPLDVAPPAVEMAEPGAAPVEAGAYTPAAQEDTLPGDGVPLAASNASGEDAYAIDPASEVSGIVEVPEEEGDTRRREREWAEIHEPTLARRLQAGMHERQADVRDAEEGPADEGDATRGTGGKASARVPERGGRGQPAALDRGDYEPENAPDATGDFSQISPVRLLYQLASAGSTGLLSVSVGGIRKRIYLRCGAPTYVSSNVFSERFGEYLVQQGVIFPGELSMALAVMPRYQNRLGEALVSLSLLSPLDMLRHLTQQVRKKLVDVCTWTVGTYVWHDGRDSPREAFPLDLNAYEILGAGALTMPEDAIRPWLCTVSEMRPRLESAGRTAPQVFQIGTPMRRVCKALDGISTVAELYTRFAAQSEHDRFVRLLYLLIETKLAAAA